MSSSFILFKSSDVSDILIQHLRSRGENEVEKLNFDELSICEAAALTSVSLPSGKQLAHKLDHWLQAQLLPCPEWLFIFVLSLLIKTIVLDPEHSALLACRLCRVISNLFSNMPPRSCSAAVVFIVHRSWRISVRSTEKKRTKTILHCSHMHFKMNQSIHLYCVLLSCNVFHGITSILTLTHSIMEYKFLVINFQSIFF